MDKLQMKEIRKQVRAAELDTLQKNINDNFQDLLGFVSELNNTNSKNEKIDIIKSYKDNEFIKNVLHYTYNPFMKYNVTSKNCKKNSDLVADTYFDLFVLLDKLANRELTGHDAIAACNAYADGLDFGEEVHNNPYKELFWCIIDKNLKTRTDSSINKAIPGLIPEFKVALAQPYDKQAKKVDFETQHWFASRKLDGVRCLALVDEDCNVKLYSRQGNEFETLQKIQDDIQHFCETNDLHGVVFDGEICLMDEDGNEDFQGIMKQIKRKDHQIDNPMFKIFDMITAEDFFSQCSIVPLQDRIAACVKYYNNTIGISNLDHVSILEQWPITTDAHFQSLCTTASKQGWEGLMIREDVGYEGKRTNSLLKVKKFHDAEYTVNNLIIERHRVIDSVTGLETEREMLAAVEIEHKGNIVKVGSGWSQEQRIKYFYNPEDLLGKTITVQYFEETTNKDGEHSLRFPTVKFVYENGRTV
jgi:DNA ligase-1